MTEHIRLLCGVLLLSLCQSAAALYDPTRPTDPSAYFGRGQPTRPAHSWTLHSILHGSDRRVAVINGKRVHEGDRIGSARVLQIAPDQVVLKTGKRRLTLRLLPASKKVSP